LLANPGGGRGRVARHLAELQGVASRRGWPFEISSDAADLTARARRAANDGVERLLVAGGDGTVHWSLQGLAGSETALAVVPMGSGNDIASVLGFDRDVARCAEMADAAPIREIDLGRVGDRWFGGVAGAGFDGEVNRYANRRFRRLSGPPIYILATLRVLATFAPPQLRLVTPNEHFEGRAYFAAFANCHRYGGGMKIAPEASLLDGLLDLVVVRAVPKWVLLTIFPRVFSGRHCSHPAVWMSRSPWADLSFDREFQAFGDGESLVPVPVTGRRFEVVPRAVRAVAPALVGR
jgi:diacylglycerol kinase (ATP)